MAAETIVTELLKFIANKVGSEVCKSLVEAADIDSQVKGLQDIKTTIEATLLDAHSSQVCSHSQRDVLEKLERGLAKLIDFQDAKATKAKQKELMGGNKFTKETRLFFSCSNQLVSPFKDARKIKSITGELSLITRNHAQFGSILSSPSFNQTQTVSNISGSYMSTDMVVGRDGDRDNIVSLLLDSSAAAGILPVASIVGIGGVGKTTLAQYVYNDERIRRCFELQLWVFVTQNFNVKDVLWQMVGANEEEALNHDMDQLQQRFNRAITGKRFLLVLDGVWDEVNLRMKWRELIPLLRAGAQGSQVLLTTRSDTVAKIIGTQDPYMVTDLGDDDSWLLFRDVAITKWHEPGVEAIGKEIVKMCHNVPLAIQVIGSLLAGKLTVREWRAFGNAQLTSFASYGSDVIGTLKLSYDQLDIGLKLCVAYCSLFPKGFRFERHCLKHLWIAMGYVKGEYTNQSLEDVAEDYLLCLLKRGFFYPREREGYEWTNQLLMHNLMHDFVLSIAGVKYKMADSNTTEFDGRVCHVSFVSAPDSPWKALSSLFKIKHLKSFLLPLPASGVDVFEKIEIFPLENIVLSRFQSLRVLRMHGLGINKLPRSLGELIHLRYLDLSFNSFRKLPDSVTQLVNLYLLDLSYCSSLEELPVDISKLVMLSHLDLNSCTSLSHMPKNLVRLAAGLKTLNHYVVGKPRNSISLNGFKANSACGLADLSGFDKLQGLLTIDLVDRSEDIVSEAKAVNLDSKRITSFRIEFRGSKIQDEMVLENLKPGTDLKNLRIVDYAGKRLPRWMREDIQFWLPNLVSVCIYNCHECIYLGSFGKLAHLRYLILCNFKKVEYIENGDSSSNKDNMLLVPKDEDPPTPLFPSLLELNLSGVPGLKGWWNGTDSARNHQLLKRIPAFPKLEKVGMDMSVITSLAKVFLPGISSVRRLNVINKLEVEAAQQTYVPSHMPPKPRQAVILLNDYLPMLRSISFCDKEMELIPEEFRGMSSLKTLEIYECRVFQAIPQWIDSLTSLDSFYIRNCPRLKSLPYEMSNLSNLKSLTLKNCSLEIAERCQEPSGEDWPKIKHIANICIEPLRNDEP